MMTFQSVLKSIAILMILGGAGIIWFGLNMIKWSIHLNWMTLL